MLPLPRHRAEVYLTDMSMTSSRSAGQPRAEVAVIGAGPTGLCAALALARLGLRVAAIGPVGVRDDGRTIALMQGSVRLLERLGAWEAAAPHATPLEVMRLVDDTGSLFRIPPVDFRASEIGLDAFGWNVSNVALVQALEAVVGRAPAIDRIAHTVTGYDFGPESARLTLSDGAVVEVGLVVAADGRHSPAREAAGIRAHTHPYGQVALTAVVEHSRPHGNVSTEFHTRQGPCVVVPSEGRRSSVVWVMSSAIAKRIGALDDNAFCEALERRIHSLLGTMRIAGARGAIPLVSTGVDRLVGERVALIGEAAHVFPPIGAQGLNLGFRDVGHLADAIEDGLAAGRAPGSGETLHDYARRRAFDVKSRSTAVDMLNRSLLADILPVDFLRGAGLLALDAIGPLRRLAMREGLAPSRGLPRLMAEARASA